MAAGKATLDLSITGMTCGSCVRHVGDALKSVAGVEEARVDLQAGTATVSYDPSRAGEEEMVRAVADAGYRAAPALEPSHAAVPTSGCSCASCG